MEENVFADEWRECLQAHYTHVIRNKDKVTEPSLTVVMHQAGFNDHELAELRVRATMHMDDVDDDFVPDLDVLAAIEDVSHEEVTETRAFTGVDLPEVQPVETVVELTAEAVLEEVAEENEIAAEPADVLDETPPETTSTLEEPEDPDAPQQLTLF